MVLGTMYEWDMLNQPKQIHSPSAGIHALEVYVYVAKL